MVNWVLLMFSVVLLVNSSNTIVSLFLLALQMPIIGPTGIEPVTKRTQAQYLTGYKIKNLFVSKVFGYEFNLGGRLIKLSSITLW